MTGVVEAAGEIGTGAAWARAAEPHAGSAPEGTHEGACMNCGAALIGRYCHQCGQSSHVHRTLMSIVHDLAHGVFHFEGKIWRTLPMLVFHPGRLTRRYIDGERARFVSPLALFLFTVFLMFASFSALGQANLSRSFEQGWSRSTVEFEKARARTAAELAAATRERAQLVATGQPTAAVDRKLVNLRDDARSFAAVGSRLAPTNDEPIAVNSSIGWLDHAIQRARENPGLTIYKVQSAAYKFSWALILVSTPLVGLLFLWRRRFGLYDHATFVTYSISFMSLLVIVVQILAAIGAPRNVGEILLMLVVPLHMFAQLRGAYALGVFAALWRMVMLLIFSGLALALFTLGVVALEVAH